MCVFLKNTLGRYAEIVLSFEILCCLDLVFPWDLVIPNQG